MSGRPDRPLPGSALPDGGPSGDGGQSGSASPWPVRVVACQPFRVGDATWFDLAVDVGPVRLRYMGNARHVSGPMLRGESAVGFTSDELLAEFGRVVGDHLLAAEAEEARARYGRLGGGAPNRAGR